MIVMAPFEFLHSTRVHYVTFQNDLKRQKSHVWPSVLITLITETELVTDLMDEMCTMSTQYIEYKYRTHFLSVYIKYIFKKYI